MSEICNGITDGSHNPPTGGDKSAFMMLSSKNIYDDKITFDEPRYLTEEQFAAEDRRTCIKAGDVLMTIVGTVGRTAVVNNDSSITLQRSVAVLHPRSDCCDSRYLMYLLRSKRSFFEAEAHGVAQKGLYLKQLSDVRVKIPAIPKQQVIVREFDKVQQIIATRQDELDMLDHLIKARFVEMFGDPVTNPNGYLVQTLQQLIDSGFITYHLDGNHGGDYPRSEEFVDSGVPYIGANCIANGQIDFSMAKYLTEERAGKLRKGIARNEDVLFAHNATVGPTVVLYTELPKVILSTSLTAYRCNQKKIKPNYLKAYMQSEGFVRQYSGEMKQTTRNQVPITAQKRYLFLVPPLEEQERFATLVAQVDKSKEAIKKSLAETQTLFDSLMQEYFG